MMEKHARAAARREAKAARAAARRARRELASGRPTRSPGVLRHMAEAAPAPTQLPWMGATTWDQLLGRPALRAAQAAAAQARESGADVETAVRAAYAAHGYGAPRPPRPVYERPNDAALAELIARLEAAGEDVTALRTYRREDGNHWTLQHRNVDDMAGISSALATGLHMALWDFDDAARESDVLDALRAVQSDFDLPRVDVFASGKPGHYLAMSPCARPLPLVARIVLCTPGIDLVWAGVGISRGSLVIRATPKAGRNVTRIATLDSARPPEADMLDLQAVVYEARL